MSFEIEVVVDRGVGGGEFLEASHSSKSEHRPLSSSKGQVAVLGPIVEPPPDFLVIIIADCLHCGSIRLQPICHYGLWLAVSLHRFAQKLQRCLAIPAFSDKRFEHFAFMIDGPPEVMCLTIYLHEHLVQMPLPLRPGA